MNNTFFSANAIFDGGGIQNMGTASDFMALFRLLDNAAIRDGALAVQAIEFKNGHARQVLEFVRAEWVDHPAWCQREIEAYFATCN